MLIKILWICFIYFEIKHILNCFQLAGVVL